MLLTGFDVGTINDKGGKIQRAVFLKIGYYTEMSLVEIKGSFVEISLPEEDSVRKGILNSFFNYRSAQKNVCFNYMKIPNKKSVGRHCHRNSDKKITFCQWHFYGRVRYDLDVRLSGGTRA